MHLFHSKEGLGGGDLRCAVEHIAYLSKALWQHKTRLIYVALPCKKTIYPELISSSFRQGATTAPQWRKMVLELLQKDVEVIDMFPHFMQNKNTNHLFDFEHFISYEGAKLTAKVIADYLKETSFFETKTNSQFELVEKLKNRSNRFYRVNFVFKDEKPYIPYNENLSNICIFGNCNLQAFHKEGAGIVANLAYQMNQEIDYIGRKLIFAATTEKFDKQAYEQCCKRDIAICISFPSGSFVRTSAKGNVSIVSVLKELLKNKSIYGKWSDINLS